MESKLTPDQLEELKEAFAIYDLNGDGRITARELGFVMRSLGQNPTEAELIAFIEQIDTDQSGNIDFQEFCKIMLPRMKPMDMEEDLMEAFRVFDIEGKGYITVHQLLNTMTNLGEKLSEEEVQEMVNEADDDGDGVINYEDFVKIMTSK